MRGFLLALAIVIGTPAWGLDPKVAITQYGHAVWTTADGLPHNSIRAIAQTRDGYLWVITSDGLARFDGVGFTVFTAAHTPEGFYQAIWFYLLCAAAVVLAGTGVHYWQVRGLRRHEKQLAERVEERTAALRLEVEERKRAEEAAEDAKQAGETANGFLRTLIESLPDLIYAKDDQGRFLLANSSVAKMMGAPAVSDL